MNRTIALTTLLAMTIGYTGTGFAQGPADMFKAMGDAVKKMEQQDQQSSPSSKKPATVQQPQEKPTIKEPKIQQRDSVAVSGTPEPSTKPASPVVSASIDSIDNFRGTDARSKQAIRNLVFKAAEFACKGDRWLGMEDAYACGTYFFMICARTKHELKYSGVPQGCHASLPPLKDFAEQIAWLDDERDNFNKPIKKAAILDSAPTRQDIDKKLAHTEAVCGKLVPELNSVTAIDIYVKCNFAVGAPAVGAKYTNLGGGTNPHRFDECDGSLLESRELWHYCSKKIVSWANGILSKVTPAYLALQRKEIEAYMSTGSTAQAKKKIDSVIDGGVRNIGTLKEWCKRLYGPLDLNKDEFLPKCETYVTLKLDSLTGGQASKNAASDEMSEALSNYYLAYITVQACYDARKEFQIQYVTSGQLSQATKDKNAIEANFVKNGANKEVALKRANSKIPAGGVEMLSASQSQFMKSRKEACANSLQILRLFAPAAQ